MVAIGSISGSWNPGRGIVTEWTASPYSRELAALAPDDPLPPTFQQGQHLRSAHSARKLQRRTPRLILTSWNVAGWCDIAAMTGAINAHLRRRPLRWRSCLLLRPCFPSPSRPHPQRPRGCPPRNASNRSGRHPRSRSSIRRSRWQAIGTRCACGSRTGAEGWAMCASI